MENCRGICEYENIRKKWEGIREWIENRGSKIRTIVGGDFHARTGEQGERWKGGIEEKEREKGGRKSRDRKMNGEGRYMLEALEEAGWFIFNGEKKGDEEGEWTYAGGRGESVIDYMIGDEEVWEKISKIKMADRINSNHFPLVVWIKRGEEGEGRKRGG